MDVHPIGIFDSGVGGLSVMRHIRDQLPHERLVYAADQAHVPYGSRPPDEIRRLSQGVTRFLLEYGAKLIVVACNTASGAALSWLRQEFPHVPFVGMEPAVKPAAAHTKSGKVGVLATTGTFESQRYVDLMARYARGIEIVESSCPGLVEKIEAGEIASPATRELLRHCLHPMLAAGVDTLVLGCTHYPFVTHLVVEIAGDAAQIIDPAPAVARQTGRMLAQNGLLTQHSEPGELRAFTSGDPIAFAHFYQRVFGHSLEVESAQW